MDSLTQIALGSALGIAVMGRRTAVWKAALWGGIAGTLPDLDVLIDYGDPVRNMTFHRAWSHSLFYLTLLAPVLAGLIALLHREPALFRRWWLAIWLALFTHPLLDGFTVYGTQLLQPFTDRPFAIGSIFIIDPLYTLPLLIGVIVALCARNTAGFRWNAAGIALSSAYLAWTVIAQMWILHIVRDSPLARSTPYERILITPTAFNTLLWRVVVREQDGYHEGFHSVLDRTRLIRFDRFDSDRQLAMALHHNWSATRLAWFSRGFYKVEAKDGEVHMSDLRMGQEPHYTFSFLVARRAPDGTLTEVRPEMRGSRGDVGAALRWIWRRMWGEQLPPPR